MRKIMLTIFLFALLVFSVLLFTTRGAKEAKFMEMGDGNTLYVGGDGPNNYTTIQDALNDADDGDTIFVYSGVYHATGTGISIFKSVRLVGEDRDTTIIDNNGSPLSTQVDGVRIENFSIINGGPRNNGIGISYAENVTIKNCKLSNNYNGVSMEGVSHAVISGCIIFSNNRSISIGRSSDVDVENCIFYSNENGIRMDASVHCSVSNCSFTGEGILITGEPENISHYVHDIYNNRVNGKPLLYYYGERNMVLKDVEVGELILVDCKNFKIQNMSISETEVGMEIEKGEKISIINCSFHDNNYYGIFGGYVSDSVISNCEIYKNGWRGIDLAYSRNNTMEGCRIYSNHWSGIILVDESYNNLIFNSSIYDHLESGIVMTFCGNNNISDCNIYENNKGVDIFFSSRNIIYRSNISSNKIGINVDGNSIYTTIYRCDIYSNRKGLEIGIYFVEMIMFRFDFGIRMNDMVYQNNFIKNLIHAHFFNVRHITWDSNYWDNWKGIGRKIIMGSISIAFYNLPLFLLMNFDKHPAEEPW